MADHPLQHLIDNNARWATQSVARDPDFFRRLVRQQAPEYLWIGCSDARVPANDVVGLLPGELFVHRNVANVVQHSDVNCQSVIQFAVQQLKVRHIMVVGHYGCGGVMAALRGDRLPGVVDYWLGHVRDVMGRYKPYLDAEPDERSRASLLVELNVLEQAINVGHSAVLQDAWARGQPVSIHGWVYALGDGRVRELGLSVSAAEDLKGLRETALERLLGARSQRREAVRPEA
jgi:carbonic anhydrase